MGYIPSLLSGPVPGPDSSALTSEAELGDLLRYAVISAIHAGASHADAQDIAQRVLLGLWTSPKVIRQRRAWVRVAAQREFWQLARARNRETLMTSADLAYVLADTDWGHKPIDDVVEQDQVLGWIGDLPLEEEMVITMLMAGFTPPEIADRLKTPPPLVRTRLRRAREKLRAAYVAQLTEDRQTEQRPAAPRNKPATRPPTASQPARDEPDLTGLPPRQQEVLQLSRDGYKPAQIARVLAISPNTVRVNLYHARKRIRQATGAA